jgi:CubicO group peptidase (beta-lactamase class C family)
VSARLDAAVARGDLPNLHGVVLVRHGKLVLERYYSGPDEHWGTPVGKVTFGPEVKHDLRSISKSIVGLLYGIALGEGRVPAPDRPLLDRFPAYADLAAEPARGAMTVAHALTMTLGTEWDESLPYTDPRNSEIAMDRAPDRNRYILERPMVADPGSRWIYNGGTTAVLAHLIAQGTATPLMDYARARLFAPLGIADAEWASGADGVPAAASGLRLRPRDLAKIGQMVLDRGRWNRTQVVPAAWLEDSFRRGLAAVDGLDYGYQWWLSGRAAEGEAWVAGFGNGGQRLVIVPGLELVLVVAAGNYNQLDAWKVPVAVMRDILRPAMRGR